MTSQKTDRVRFKYVALLRRWDVIVDGEGAGYIYQHYDGRWWYTPDGLEQKLYDAYCNGIKRKVRALWP